MISKETGGEGGPPGSRARPQAAAPLAKIRSPTNSSLEAQYNVEARDLEHGYRNALKVNDRGL